MSLFTIFFVLIIAPLLKHLARLAGFALVFPFAFALMLAKTCFAPTLRRISSQSSQRGASINR